MKKTLWILAVLLAPYFAAHGQDSNNDDVYYNNNDDQQQPDPNQQDPNAQPQDQPTYQSFYDQLNPYGSWQNTPDNGYVWVPNGLGADFSPYLTGGHWVYTTYGWTWVSDYDWGWGPFHYGRWYRDDSYGWAWVPGYDWAPAWVVWGNYGGYYCWAPVGPRAVLGSHYRPDPHYWNFVPHERISEPGIRTYVVNHNEAFHGDYAHINQNVTIVNHANTYNQSVFYAGPKAAEVEKYSGHKVERVNVTNVSKPGATKVSGNQVNIYRPAIARSNNQPAPRTNNQTAQPNRANVQEQNRNVQQQQPNRNVQPAPVQHNNVEPQRQVQQPARQEWTPPRQSIPQTERPQPVQRSAPVQQQRPVDRGFVPSQRPMQQSAPQQHFSAPQQSAPRSMPMQSAPRGGGGGRR